MRTAILMASVTIASLITNGVEARPVTFQCKLIKSTSDWDRFRLVDQVVLDPEAPLIDLRIASTMGTEFPENWTYSNADGDTIQAHTDSIGNHLFAGIRAGTATAFSFDTKGNFVATYTSSGDMAVSLH
jgi:hypothetical protein